MRPPGSLTLRVRVREERWAKVPRLPYRLRKVWQAIVVGEVLELKAFQKSCVSQQEACLDYRTVISHWLGAWPHSKHSGGYQHLAPGSLDDFASCP